MERGLDPDVSFGLPSKAPETPCVKENPVRSFETHWNTGNRFKPSTVSHGTQPVLGGCVHNIPEMSQAHNRRRHKKTSATNFSAYSHSGKFCPLKVQRAHHPCTGTSSPIIQMIGIESQPPYSSEARYYSCESLEYANGLLWKRE